MEDLYRIVFFKVNLELDVYEIELDSEGPCSLEEVRRDWVSYEKSGVSFRCFEDPADDPMFMTKSEPGCVYSLRFIERNSGDLHVEGTSVFHQTSDDEMKESAKTYLENYIRSIAYLDDGFGLFNDKWYSAIILNPDSQYDIELYPGLDYTTPKEIKRYWKSCIINHEFGFRLDIPEPEFDKGYTMIVAANRDCRRVDGKKCRA